MTSADTGIVEFLTACLDRLERTASDAALPGAQTLSVEDLAAIEFGRAYVAEKRSVLKSHSRSRLDLVGAGGLVLNRLGCCGCPEGAAKWSCDNLRALALPFQGWDGFDPAWLPETP